MSDKDPLNISPEDFRIPSKEDFVVQFSDGQSPDLKVTAVKRSSPGKVVDEEGIENLSGLTLSDKYLLMKRLGGGGMGSVYLARHVVIEKQVAVKVLHPHLSAKKSVAERFMREAKAASKIHHENVVDVSDYGETRDGIIYIVMEFLEGRELREVMDQTGAMEWGRARNITIQTAKALCAAHKHNIIHRDVKPANIFLTTFAGNDDFVKIIDFGIAKVTQQEGTLTKTGTIMGTPDYMAPEQAAGKPVGRGCDIYSTGIILYELITGTVPFDADSFMGVLTKHMFEKPVAPSKRFPEGKITRAMDAIVLKAIAKEPKERFRTMEEFITALESVDQAGSGPVVEIAEHDRPEEGHPVLISFLVILLFLGAAAGFLFYMKNRSPSTPAEETPTTPKVPVIAPMAEVPKKASLLIMNIVSDVAGTKVWLERGILQTGEGKNSALLGPGAPLGTTPITALTFTPRNDEIVLKVATPEGKIQRFTVRPNKAISLAVTFKSGAMVPPVVMRPYDHSGHTEPAMVATPPVTPPVTPLAMKEVVRVPATPPAMKENPKPVPVMKEIPRPMPAMKGMSVKPGPDSGGELLNPDFTKDK